MRSFIQFLREASRVPFPVAGVTVPLTIERVTDVLDQHPIYRVFRQDRPDERVGYAKLSRDGRSVMDVVIAPAWQRQGLASALYDYIEQDRQITLRPSPLSQSAAGKAFWSARQARPVHEAPTRATTSLQRPRILVDIPTSHFDDDGEENIRFASVRANPTRTHLQDDEAYDRTGTIGGKKNQYYFGAWLSPTTQSWYTFPRTLVQHEDTIGAVRTAVPAAARASLIPIRLYVDRTGVITTIKNAPWTDDHFRSTNEIKQAVASIPNLQALVRPTTTYEVDRQTTDAQHWQKTQLQRRRSYA